MNFQEVVGIAQKAWDETKDKTDPVWADCAAHHKQTFAATAQAVIATGHAVNDFEHCVKRLAQDAEVKRELIEEVQSENPTLHSDEQQLIATQKTEDTQKNRAIFNDATGPLPPADAKTLRSSKPTPDGGVAVSVATKRPRKKAKKGGAK